MRNESMIRLFNIVRENKKMPYRYIPYKKQLKMKEWELFRLYVIISKGIKCELCDYNHLRYLQVHHKRYKKGLMAWQYELEDMMVVCKTHHKKIHMPEIREKYNRTKSINNLIDGKKIYGYK
jgi:5-methylcytosine-specific restriction endonuclease McrA